LSEGEEANAGLAHKLLQEVPEVHVEYGGGRGSGNG